VKKLKLLAHHRLGTPVLVASTQYIQNRNNYSWPYLTSVLRKGMPYHFGQAIVIPGHTVPNTVIWRHSLNERCWDRLTFAWNNFQRLSASSHNLKFAETLGVTTCFKLNRRAVFKSGLIFGDNGSFRKPTWDLNSSTDLSSAFKTGFDSDAIHKCRPTPKWHSNGVPNLRMRKRQVKHVQGVSQLLKQSGSF